MLLIIIYNKDLDNVILKSGKQTREVYEEKSVKRIAKVFTNKGYEVHLVDGNLDMFQKLRNIIEENEEIPFVFNLAYGIQGEDRYSHIPSILEMLGLPYLGSGPLGHTLAMDKIVSKIMMLKHNIATPWYKEFHAPEDTDRGIEFPVIVKPSMEADSHGLKIIDNHDELSKEVASMFDEYAEAVIVEEFIRGREFVLALIGNGNNIECFPLIEIDLGESPDKMYTFENKRQTKEKLIPGDIPQKNIRAVEKEAKRLFSILRLKDYARVDLRMDTEGNFYFLEINSMASLIPTGSFAAAAEAAGYTFDEMIMKLLDTGVCKYFEKHKKLKEQYESHCDTNRK